uniref:Chemokine interleukin-8-like domain-containing protein n=2 Tax=Cyprinus carpio TaxID=7962 RepID=A0A8C1K7Z2_CYPCA
MFSLLAKSMQTSIANVILCVGFEEEEGGCSTFPYQTTVSIKHHVRKKKKNKQTKKKTHLRMWCRLGLSQTSATAGYQSLKISFRSETMRASSLCLVFGLVLLMARTSEAQLALAVPKKCCFNFIDFQIPKNRIVSAVRISSRCPSPGIVVTTTKKELCVKPDKAWIKTYMKNHAS